MSVIRRGNALPPDAKGKHEPVWHYEQRMARKRLIEGAPAHTEVDASGREWVVRRLDDALGQAETASAWGRGEGED